MICASAMFLVGLDTTIVTIGLPEIGRALDVGAHDLAWVVDGYTVVFASLLITSGALADRFGRRRVFMTGLAVFGLASLVCAGAPSLDVLVAARAAQGVGASMLGPVALAIVVNAMPDRRERARAIGVWASVFGLSMAAGPAAGGALIAVLDWRAVFWVNVPVVLAALALVAAFVPESRGARVRRLDLPGQLLLAVLLGAGIAVLIEGPELGWTSPAAMVGYGVVAAAAVLFPWYESRRREPLIDPGLFRSPGFTGAVLGAVAVFVALSTTLVMTTFHWQGVHGWTPLAAGLVTLPLAVGATVCAPLSGLLVGRVGARLPLVVAGVSLAAGGGLLLVLADGAGGLFPLLGCYLLVGVGVGFANAPITDTAVNGLPPERAGVAGGTASTARQVGTAIGVALGGGLVANAGPAGFAAASRPGWAVVALCGAALLVTAWTARGTRVAGTPRAPRTSGAGRTS